MKTFCAVTGLLLVLGAVAAPTAAADPLPEGWDTWRTCHGYPVDQLDCTASQAVGKAALFAGWACERWLGGC